MENDELRFPDLNDAFDGAISITMVTKNYEKLLRKQGDIKCILYANKLEQFRKMLLTTTLKELEREFHELKEYVREICKKNGVSITLQRRKKDFIGINEKIRLFLKTEKPLERVQDLLGFRLIILSGQKDDEKSVQLCYEVLNEVIRYFVVERGCLLAEAEPILDGKKERTKEQEEIIIPAKSLVSSEFRTNVKDYVINPKHNGYQSLHVVFKKTDGLVFELQIRTMAMDIVAEYGSASHNPYKAKRYGEGSIALDLKKVNMPGFTVLQDGSIIDFIGLTKSVDPFNLL